MNPPPRHDPDRVDMFCRIYAAMLHVYPRSHRLRWGAEMRQAFRDRCIEAAREPRGLNRWLLWVALPDLFASALREGFTTVVDSMQGQPMRNFNRITLGIVLEVLGSGMLAIAAIGLWAAVRSDRFAHPGAFDALALLQVAFGITGAILLAMGIRELVAVPRVRRS